MEGKSAKAKYVVEAAQSFLSGHFFVTKSNYVVFIKNAKLQVKQGQGKMDSVIAKLKLDVTTKERSYERIKKLLEEDESGTLKVQYDLDKTLKELTQVKERCNEMISIRKDAPNALPTFEEYLKLFKSTSDILGKIRDMKQMDTLIRIFFSNFTITATEKDFRKGAKVSYKLNEPYAGFVENGDFVIGAGNETLTRGLILGKDAL